MISREKIRQAYNALKGMYDINKKYKNKNFRIKLSGNASETAADILENPLLSKKDRICICRKVNSLFRIPDLDTENWFSIILYHKLYEKEYLEYEKRIDESKKKINTLIAEERRMWQDIGPEDMTEDFLKKSHLQDEILDQAIKEQDFFYQKTKDYVFKTQYTYKGDK